MRLIENTRNVYSGTFSTGLGRRFDAMLHSGKCPHCEKTVTYAKAEAIDIKVGSEGYKGVSYLCPMCRSVLSISMDPLALNQNLVNRLLVALGKG
jgi:hypothetical protein